MRTAFVLIAAAMSVANPAAAQDRAPPPPSLDAVASGLSNPMVQDALASTITGIADAVMATRVGPLARLTDPRDDIRPGDTLADIKRRDDPYYRERLYDDSRRGAAAAGAAAHDMAGMAVELGATVARLRAALAPLGAATDAYRNEY